MSFWNLFRLFFNSVIIIGIGYAVRNFTHTNKSMPNGKQILTMAAEKGYKLFQYSVKKKNRNGVVFISLAIVLLIMVSYKVIKRYNQKSISFDSENEDGNKVSNSNGTKSDKKTSWPESLDKQKCKWWNSWLNNKCPHFTNMYFCFAQIVFSCICNSGNYRFHAV